VDASPPPVFRTTAFAAIPEFPRVWLLAEGLVSHRLTQMSGQIVLTGGLVIPALARDT
jgi:hypothetical protein